MYAAATMVPCGRTFLHSIIVSGVEMEKEQHVAHAYSAGIKWRIRPDSMVLGGPLIDMIF